MASPLRPRAIPQCSACLRSYTFPSASEPAIGSMGLGQQVRGKKKVVHAPTTVPVRLLKNVKTFGREGKLQSIPGPPPSPPSLLTTSTGAIVPISPGRMRNEWFPRRIASYITPPQLRTLRLKNTPVERNFSYGLAEAQPLSVGANQAPPSDFPAAMMMQPTRKTPEIEKLAPERAMQLIEIFVPPRLEFYRQPIPDESFNVEEDEMKEEPKPRFRGAAADLYAARLPQREVKERVQGIYGSVTVGDVLAAVRAVMSNNPEAAKVGLSESEIRFVEGGEEVEEGGRIKNVGTFGVEFRVKGAEEGVRRVVRVHAQDV